MIGERELVQNERFHAAKALVIGSKAELMEVSQDDFEKHLRRAISAFIRYTIVTPSLHLRRAISANDAKNSWTIFLTSAEFLRNAPSAAPQLLASLSLHKCFPRGARCLHYPPLRPPPPPKAAFVPPAGLPQPFLKGSAHSFDPACVYLVFSGEATLFANQYAAGDLNTHPHGRRPCAAQA